MCIVVDDVFVRPRFKDGVYCLKFFFQAERGVVQLGGVGCFSNYRVA